MQQKLYLYTTKKKRIMDLEARKYQFIEKVFNLNEHLFEQLENLLNKQAQEGERISIEQYNKEIDLAIEDIENGNFYTMEEVKKRASQW